MVDGPETGVPRQKLRLSQIHLTKFKVSFPFHGPTRVVRKAWKTSQMDDKWAKSRWAERLRNKEIVSYSNATTSLLFVRIPNVIFRHHFQRASLTDFDRFKLKRARATRNKIRTEEYKKLLKRVYNPIRKTLRNKRAKKRALSKKAGKTAATKKTVAPKKTTKK